MDETGDPGVRRLGALGGTFDPIHVGHLVAASEALHRFTLDRVVFVPAGRPWQKSSYSDQEDRFLMTSLAVAGHPRFSVSRIELDRQGPTYTVDTLQMLKDFYEDCDLLFIVGADALGDLPTWHRAEELAEFADIIAIARPGFDLDATPQLERPPRVHRMEMPLLDISSTDIRRRVREGLPIDYLVAPEVARYVRTHGLYAGAEEKQGA